MDGGPPVQRSGPNETVAESTVPVRLILRREVLHQLRIFSQCEEGLGVIDRGNLLEVALLRADRAQSALNGLRVRQRLPTVGAVGTDALEHQLVAHSLVEIDHVGRNLDRLRGGHRLFTNVRVIHQDLLLRIGN